MSLKKPDLTTLPKEVSEYIKNLENALSGSSDIVVSLNIALGVISQEINEITAKGDILNSDSFDRIVTLIDKYSRIKTLTKSKDTEPVEDHEETDNEIVKDFGNIFEMMSKRAKEKLNA